MKSKKLLIGVVILLISIVPIAGAYQELHEPDVVYIEYMKEGGGVNILGMYESAADTLIRDIGESCFQKVNGSEKATKNKRYLLLNEETCNNADGLFSAILKLYKEALNTPQNETVMDMATKIGVVRVKIGGGWALKSLSVEVNKAKKIITALII